MNRIIFDNVTTLNKEKNKFSKLIKNFNCSFDEGKIISFISEDIKSKEIIVGLLLGKVSPISGKLHLPQGQKISYISNKNFLNIQNNFLTGSSFLLKDFKNNKAVKKKLVNEKNKLEKDILFLNSEIKIWSLESNKRKFSEQGNILIKEWISVYAKEIIKIDEINTQVSILQDKYNTLDDNFQGIAHWKKNEKKILLNYFTSKDISIRDDNKLNNVNITKYRNYELSEIKNIVQKYKATDDQTKVIYLKLKDQSKEIIRFLKGLKIPGFELSKKEIEFLSKINGINAQRDWLIEFDILVNFLNKLSLSVDNETKKEIGLMITYITNIKNHRSPLNSVSFNKIYSLTINNLKQKIIYYETVIMDIEKLIQEIIKKDKGETKFLRRNLWEFQIISLRFQKQIYSEKKVIVSEYLSSITEIFFRHTRENINEFYTEIRGYERTMLVIDLSLNNWRFKRQLKEIELKSKIKTEEILIQKNKIRKELSIWKKTSERKRSEKISSLIKYYKNLSLSQKNKDEIVDKFEDSLNNIRKIKKKNILAKNKKLMDIKDEIFKLTTEEKENQMLQLLEEISFNLEIIGNPIQKMIKEDIQRLLIVSSIMKESKIIVIDEPQTEIDPDTKASIQNTIKKLSKKYGITFIVFTRNLKSALEYSDLIAFMERGTIWEYGNPKTIMKNHIHPITKEIIENADKIKFINDGIKFVNFNQKNLLHSQFSPLKEYKISNNHYIFCSEWELEKWGIK